MTDEKTPQSADFTGASFRTVSVHSRLAMFREAFREYRQARPAREVVPEPAATKVQGSVTV